MSDMQLNVRPLNLYSDLILFYVAEDVFILSAFQEGKRLKLIYNETLFTIGLMTQRSYLTKITKER